EADEQQTDWFRSLPLDQLPIHRETGMAPYFFDWLQHFSRDAYWREVSIEDRHDRVRARALHIAGWYDIFMDGSLKNYVGIRDRGASQEARQGQRLMVGPWLHSPNSPRVGQMDFGPAASGTIIDE